MHCQSVGGRAYGWRERGSRQQQQRGDSAFFCDGTRDSDERNLYGERSDRHECTDRDRDGHGGKYVEVGVAAVECGNRKAKRQCVEHCIRRGDCEYADDADVDADLERHSGCDGEFHRSDRERILFIGGDPANDFESRPGADDDFDIRSDRGRHSHGPSDNQQQFGYECDDHGWPDRNRQLAPGGSELGGAEFKQRPDRGVQPVPRDWFDGGIRTVELGWRDLLRGRQCPERSELPIHGEERGFVRRRKCAVEYYERDHSIMAKAETDRWRS